MNRRTFVRSLSVLGTGLALSGCDGPHLGLRRHDRDADVAPASDADPTDSNQILDVQSDPAKPRPFFKSSRLQGGLSDEAREIESHVGIR